MRGREHKEGKHARDRQDHRVLAQKPQSEGNARKIPPPFSAARDHLCAAVEGDGPEQEQGSIRGLYDAPARKEERDVEDEQEFPGPSGLIPGELLDRQVQEDVADQCTQKASDPYSEFTVPTNPREQGDDIGDHRRVVDIAPLQMLGPIPIAGFLHRLSICA